MDSIAGECNFEQVYVSFQPKIHRYLTRLIGTREAEDLTQEVFIKVEKALTNFRNESQLSTWIYRIATNTAIDRMRSTSLQRELTREQGNILIAFNQNECLEAAGLSSNHISLEDQIVHKETNQCIRGIIDKLPDNYRLIVILSDLEGLANKEIAAILGISINVVKVRLHRGKARLKKELLNHCSFSWDDRNEFTCEPKPENK